MSKVYKDKYHGWVATDTIDIGDNRRLTINTRKQGNKVATIASVSIFKDGFLTHAVFQDFCVKYQVWDAKRVTQKVVTDIHNFVNIDNIKADAIAFYNK